MSVIGIDLGTTNSLAACWDGSRVRLIPNAFGRHLTPSVVSVDEQGEILIGDIAKQRMITHPQLTVSVFKRYMGTNKIFELGPYRFTPEDLSSMILRALKEDAEAYLGEPVEEAVISVPAYFNDMQRQATRRAGQLAGLRVERLINEPTAAAIAYGLHEQAEDTKFLIYDLGGGTFDVSILEKFGDLLEVQAVAGDNFLGGEDFTRLLMQELLDRNAIAVEELDLKQKEALRKQAELAKYQLGATGSAEMNLNLNGLPLSCEVNRDRFEALAKPLLQRLRHPVERALNDARLRPSELDAVILIGGATRMPLISASVARLFGRLPSSHIDPDETVAVGAALQAAMKARNKALNDIVLTDVCPYTLGTDVSVLRSSGQYESGHFCPIIERNTVVPVSRVESFTTIHDGQSTINFQIYQGESRRTENNIKLGELKVHVPPDKAGEQSVQVRFTYDINGILEVEATVVSTGVMNKIFIEENPGQYSKEAIEQRFMELSAIKIHPRDRAENRLLLARGERLYEETLGEQREVIALWLLRFERALQSQDDVEIRREAEAFGTFLNAIERNMRF
ncbi:molecular chaperone HscC [Paenibacillus sp. M1]|uniref:Chaperone protein DnaK n=1 Tax=Paenibacillus haidiansis TaxID=1574488 RepID=A0ABU7VXD6_9BACL